MFTTNAFNEIETPWSRSGLKAWRSFETTLNLPIFHVTFRLWESGQRPQHRLMITGALQQIPESNVQGKVCCEVIDVRLLSPGWLNGTGEWQLDVLREIVVTEDATGGETVAYGLRDGRVFFEGQREGSSASRRTLRSF